MTVAARHQAQSAARLYAVQALFEMEAADAALEEVRLVFETHRFGAVDADGTEWAEADRDLFRSLLDTAVDRQARLDQMTADALPGTWPIARIDPTLRALFRAAGAELLQAETPPRVVIAEFTDIAGAFFPGGKEPGLVTAVLDRMARAAGATPARD
ncbi:MAG: transcription antitermination factor NusB [Rhodobacteraceae bacterium]|jgi:N utilization substance protein B|nr:transcription antitermination factor NusB [Paracoccaceae bacterium]MBL4556760.1 transcription antitermination factor NusB [Paracoccaceae bacterium]